MFTNTSRMASFSRTGTVARKMRKRSAGASRYGYGGRIHNTRDYRKRRASAPILSPPQRTFIRVPSPVSRSAETVARAGLSQSPSPQPSPSKSVSFSTEVEEVFISPRPDNLSLSVPRTSTICSTVSVAVQPASTVSLTAVQSQCPHCTDCSVSTLY
jgi:hypothetical protein